MTKTSNKNSPPFALILTSNKLSMALIRNGCLNKSFAKKGDAKFESSIYGMHQFRYSDITN